MHKTFYASGFLFERKTQQILLYQPALVNNPTLMWSTFEGVGYEEEDPLVCFKRIIKKKLKINLKVKNIYPVYFYFNNRLEMKNYVFYAEIEKPEDFKNIHGGTLSWFAFKQMNKIPISKQTKNDIIVSERVVKANARKRDTNPAF